MQGLILAGGQSSRMGQAKHSLVYHQWPQWQHLMHMMQYYCEEVLIAVKEETEDLAQAPVLIDDPTWGDIGPMAGLLTAMHTLRDSWCVVGVDYPFFTENDLERLIEGQKPKTLATAYRHPNTQKPEPLVAIYEYEALPQLLQQWEKGQHSLQHFLMENPVTLIKPNHVGAITSVDTMEGFQLAKSSIHGGH